MKEGVLSPQAQVDQDELDIDIKELFLSIWRARVLIMLSVAIFGLISLVYARSIPDHYRATAILAPTSGAIPSSMAQIAGQFSGLASLAGVNLNAGGVDKTGVALTLVKTWGFLEDFVKRNGLEVEVYAARGWDKKSNTLVLDDDIYDPEKKVWKIGEDLDKNTVGRPPTGWELYNAISGRLFVNQDLKTGMIKVSADHYSPYVAKRIVDLLVKEVNRRMQLNDRRQASESIEYLSRQIEETSITEMRSIFYELIEEQTKTLMLSEISNEYILKTISPAMVPEQKAGPSRLLIVIAGSMLGGLVAVVFVLVRNVNRRSR